MALLEEGEPKREWGEASGERGRRFSGWLKEEGGRGDGRESGDLRRPSESNQWIPSLTSEVIPTNLLIC